MSREREGKRKGKLGRLSLFCLFVFFFGLSIGIIVEETSRNLQVWKQLLIAAASSRCPSTIPTHNGNPVQVSAFAVLATR